MPGLTISERARIRMEESAKEITEERKMAEELISASKNIDNLISASEPSNNNK